MCTVSWSQRRGRYDLFFNRDELHSRGPEAPPQEHRRHGVRLLAPRDGDRGGSWLALNEFGLTVCLLNDYATAWRPPIRVAPRSRGRIVLAAGAARSLDGVRRTVASQPLERTAPFRLLALAPDSPPLVLHWDGHRLHRRRAPLRRCLLTSSSFRPVAVAAARRATYDRLVGPATPPAVRALARFHRQHDAAAGAFSVAMRRPDAATRSLIHVAVNRERGGLRYVALQWPAACGAGGTPGGGQLRRKGPRGASSPTRQDARWVREYLGR